MDKERLIAKAVLARRMENYHELLQIMRRILAIAAPLTPVESELLYDAYRNVCEVQKQSLIKLFDFYGRNIGNLTTRQTDLLRSYCIDIRSDLVKICEEIIDILQYYLIPTGMINMDYETTTLYLSMKGDHQTYAAEFAVESDVRNVLINEAQTAYEQGYHIARTYLPAVNSKRLGIVLNYCAFINNMQQNLPRACTLAREEIRDYELERQTGTRITHISAVIVEEIRKNLSNSRKALMRMIFPEYEYDSSSSSDS